MEREVCFQSHYLHGMSLLTRVCTDCMERRACDGCGTYKCEEEFTPSQWKRAAWLASPGKCRMCMSRNRDTKMCSGDCGRELLRSAFAKRMWDHPPHKCRECAKQKQMEKQCAGPCGQKLPQEAYSTRMWQRTDSTRKCIKFASTPVRGQRMCI